jgi:hypothetical protein
MSIPAARGIHRARNFICLLLLSACGSRTELPVVRREIADCPASARSILVLAEAASNDGPGKLLRFDPQTATFTPTVEVSCLPPIRLQTALTVDREGNAWIAGVSLDRQLVRVNTKTGACDWPGLTAAVTGFGMAFIWDPSRARDVLYVVGGGNLSTNDLSSRAQEVVAPFGAAGSDYYGTTVFLTGNGAGDLFIVHSTVAPNGQAVVDAAPATPTSIGRVDTATGAVRDEWPVSVPDLPPGFACCVLITRPRGLQGPCCSSTGWRTLNGFVFWGGDFYFFVENAVWRFRPSDGSTELIARTDSAVLAAGASTCGSF